MIVLFQDGNKINFVVIMNYKAVATRSLKRSLALMNHISSQMVDKMYHPTSQVFLIININNNCCDCVLATLHASKQNLLLHLYVLLTNCMCRTLVLKRFITVLLC